MPRSAAPDRLLTYRPIARPLIDAYEASTYLAGMYSDWSTGHLRWGTYVSHYDRAKALHKSLSAWLGEYRAEHYCMAIR